MTYNIHRWAGSDGRLDVPRLAQVIEGARADVVALNEVIHPVHVNGQAHETLAELADYLHMHYAFGASGWIDRGTHWHGPVGNAILSRYPLTETKNLLLPRPVATKQRSMLEARLAEGPARGLTAFSTHLDHAFEGTRLVQLQAALAHIRPYGPHFLAGDFNTPGFPGQRTRRVIVPILYMMRRAGYRDAFHVAGKGRGHTFPATAPLVRIDYLFLPQRWAQGLRSVHAVSMVAARHASDHRPVVAEWAWPETLGAPI
jgi:endonuclease/exonuclease/phosphatase family metal-dependent hydrolase